MESVKTGKTNKVGKNTEITNTKANKETHFKQASTITNTLRSIGGFFTKIAKRVGELVKEHPKKSNAALVVLPHVACKKELDDKVQDKSKQAEKENQINWWKYSGLTIATSLLLAACSVGDTDKQIELEQEKQKANKSGIELEQERQKTEQERQKTNKSEIELEQERQKTNKSGIELANSQIKAEQERQKTEQEKQKANKSEIELEQQKQKTINTQRDLIKEEKDFIKETEQNCQEKHGQLFIKKARIKTGITTGIAIEVEAECKTPKPTKTNQTPIQPKHLPNSKQPRSQRGSKAQELIAYLQKELESLPYSQKAIAKQVDFYKPSSIAYLELDPRDFNATEEWQKENLKIRSKAQAKMLEMRSLKPDSQAHLST
ncbi:DUF874 family protein [Helicobacter pylori]|uniref:DUF874 family protein n=1 Tax=Helicobacter pylori Hp H-24 TaxID=992039 RepID=J0KQZ8_HELPX|nr:DUF874 family protein [Helicobacter pylori]EJB53120.1 hypothetical protein HPHPH24_0328 [Helicobacter pylori Hp H-24]EJC19630.1 hypothetical protein HPHPH24B_0224 [Helicobacter pylori Hp H-24b]EJC20664.1 hypothetical protein HPHPH24C_0216 [Helicobacter pylori Hp H-24c]EJC40498.1 hypothetical protein HPHPM1_0328 [Helicobacter pylori Hp M1]EJC42636.1 hypothetical protein HPHPM2_0198 [Helicobacter pylori Hp M2]